MLKCVGRFIFMSNRIPFQYFLNIISPNNDMKAKIDALLPACPSIDTAAMGFPRGWENEPLWES